MDEIDFYDHLDLKDLTDKQRIVRLDTSYWCFRCGGRMKLDLDKTQFIKKESFEIMEIRFYFCPKCHIVLKEYISHYNEEGLNQISKNSKEPIKVEGTTKEFKIK